MSKTKLPVPGDLVIHEESQIVCRISQTINNQTASEFQAQVGHPIDASGNVVLAAAEATTVGLLLENVLLSASGSSPLPCAVINAGPNAINRDALQANDSAGGAYNVATIISTLEGLGFKFVDEPTVRTEQIN